jgi:hypothetical protein
MVPKGPFAIFVAFLSFVAKRRRYFSCSGLSNRKRRTVPCSRFTS